MIFLAYKHICPVGTCSHIGNSESRTLITCPDGTRTCLRPPSMRLVFPNWAESGGGVLPAMRSKGGKGDKTVMLAGVLPCIGFVAMLAIQPATAHADPDSEFLSWLNNYGIDLSEIMGHTITRQDAIELGHDICKDLHGGKSAEAETSEIYRGMPKISDKLAGNLVSAAQYTICPDTLT